jgi:glycosyltransferase involved in cell wall biosynthesis
MRIIIVTDAWFPQVNGVVRTLDALRKGLNEAGNNVFFITPELFRTVPCPSYSEIRLSLPPPGRVGRFIEKFQPCAIHIATEGPLGIFARRYCLKKNYPFTTAFHTRFPEYVYARWRVPLSFGYMVMKRFHRPAACTMVATPSMESMLKGRGFKNIHRWSRGVDTGLFHPRDKSFLLYPRPINLYVGRVAVEKNIEAFLSLELAGTKVVVGGGPQTKTFKARYPDVRFEGEKHGEELARYYAAADIFIFPSRTDTFGLVLLEALASGVPVAAFPVAGPLDVIDGSGAGVLDEDLKKAADRAIVISPETCLAHARKFSWENSVRQFIGNLHRFK